MRQRGFSLLEILVAFSIMALSLGVLMEIFADAARNADLARNQMRAVALARDREVDAQALLRRGERVAGRARGRELGVARAGGDDELVEITPKSIRLRKRFLKEHERKRAQRDGA